VYVLVGELIYEIENSSLFTHQSCGDTRHSVMARERSHVLMR
jgi:hypothetical protein